MQESLGVNGPVLVEQSLRQTISGGQVAGVLVQQGPEGLLGVNVAASGQFQVGEIEGPVGVAGVDGERQPKLRFSGPWLAGGLQDGTERRQVRASCGWSAKRHSKKVWAA